MVLLTEQWLQLLMLSEAAPSASEFRIIMLGQVSTKAKQKLQPCMAGLSGSSSVPGCGVWETRASNLLPCLLPDCCSTVRIPILSAFLTPAHH